MARPSVLPSAAIWLVRRCRRTTSTSVGQSRNLYEAQKTSPHNVLRDRVQACHSFPISAKHYGSEEGPEGTRSTGTRNREDTDGERGAEHKWGARALVFQIFEMIRRTCTVILACALPRFPTWRSIANLGNVVLFGGRIAFDFFRVVSFSSRLPGIPVQRSTSNPKSHKLHKLYTLHASRYCAGTTPCLTQLCLRLLARSRPLR